MDSILFWIIFNAFVLLLLGLDLFVFHRKEHEVKIKEALLWSLFWIVLSLAFNALIYYWQGPGPALEFLTGYLIEKSLSVDNLFVFIMIFSYFKVPLKFQHKILFWGIIGALVLRGIFILVGVALIAKFHFIIYILGLFLVYTGIKMAFSHSDEEVHPENNPLVKWVSRHMRITKTPEGGKFFTKQNGKLYATPLFLVLIMVESTDVVFAADSIPAILAISKDPFIVYTSNVFALLGLRALYFALAGIMQLFHYLHYGLSLILVFIGAKLLLSDVIEIDMRYALGVVGVILTVSVILSLLFPKKESELPQPPVQK
ncbi:tellurite resistance protein TerC [Pontibacter ummariensis]|uniref:Tellurite resistance protein TerC n=1 Tax=Pontibacter ummariensis TaxID=1610492 RepID=A0A239F121_9BACT|nr:TerC family protein [Pontibacter ummariensis]PRY12652.1 tellurite resistance protein TerC [Pontibacter ummariensis]SNS50401.1 tellurite resistance protein TerC [Pontibacter ummariensis]